MLCNCREGQKTYLFYVNNIFNYSHDYKHKFISFRKMNYIKTIHSLICNISCSNNKKRNIENYVLGSTCFGGPSPRYWHEEKEKHSMIPRPYKDYKPESLVLCVLKQDRYNDLINLCAYETKNYLYRSLIFYSKFDVPNASYLITQIKETLCIIDFIENHVPLALRIGNSFFTQMVVIGNTTIRKHDGIPKHLDKDMITCIINFGVVDKGGGSTAFYNGSNSENKFGKMVYEVPFEHGRIQIGFFCDIIHEVKPWNGNRMTFNLNFKLDVVEHFMDVGSLFYNEYKHHNFPSKDFVIKL